MSAGAFAGVFFYNTAGAGMPEGVAIVLAFLIGGLAAGIFGVIVGVPVLRLSETIWPSSRWHSVRF